MRRAIARGRVFPQSYSTDRRYGHLSLKSCALFPLMWANADDQGRLSGEPDEIKYSVCPSIDHISKDDIPGLLTELEQNNLLRIYSTPKSAAIQLLDWWEVHKPQWAWPSDFPPIDGWQDRLRYKRGAKEVVVFNWFSPDGSTELSPGQDLMFPLTTPLIEKETERGKRKLKEENERGRGRGNSPDGSPENSPENSPEPSTSSLVGPDLYKKLCDSFPQAFGRDSDSRENAQLRDLGKKLSEAGGATGVQVYDAFKEASGQAKLSVSYVGAILCAWVGVEEE